MRPGLRGRLVGAAVLLMVAAVALVGIATTGLITRAVEGDTRTQAERLAQVAAQSLAAEWDLVGSAKGPAQEVLNHHCERFSGVFEASRVSIVALWEPGNIEVLASWPPGNTRAEEGADLYVSAAVREPVTRVRRAEDGVRQVEVYASAEGFEDAIVALHLQVPLRPPVEGSRRLLLYTIIGDVLLLGVLGYVVLTWLVIRPIRELSLATERVAAGDLETVLPPMRVEGELATLTQSFSTMLERLRETRSALEQRVDDLQRSGRALEQAHEELVFSAKMASVGELAAGIAHEIGNPLAAVTGLLELLDDRSAFDEEEITDLVHRAEREIGRIHTIVAGLLDYARVADVAPESVSVEAPVRAALGLMAHHPRRRNVEITLRGGPALEVEAAENPLVQVLLNLLLNAVDAMEGQGQVVVDWFAASSEHGPGVILRVADTGPGVSAALQGQIFEPFVTSKTAGGGTGLGLAVSARIVTRYRGRIWVESPEGQGAVFHIWLPAPGQMPSGK